MKILVIDRDDITENIITTHLAGGDHTVMVEPDKRTACDLHAKEGFDIVLVDPAPIKQAQDVIREIWRANPKRPYIVLLAQEDTPLSDALAAGANDIKHKPLDKKALSDKINNAKRLLGLAKILADGKDTKSDGGAIAKSAFNQLFLTALDRANRYGDESFLLLLTVESGNAEDIIRHVVKARRLSDVISQVSDTQVCLLLERPRNPSEPADAAARFAEEMNKFADAAQVRPHIHVSLVELPQGAVRAEYEVV